jgi:hypothetical protein
MSLLLEEMARNEMELRYATAQRELRALRLLAARRWQRRAAEAGARARLATRAASL